MLKGHKLTHLYFENHEHITMTDPYTILTEEGYNIPSEEFWRYREDRSWDENWELFQE